MNLRCLWIQRRLDAYLDGALSEIGARGVARHLDSCHSCLEEAERQGRVASLLRVAAEGAEPDWSAFWPGIRARVGSQESLARRFASSARPTWPLGWLPRLAVGSALAGFLLLGLILGHDDHAKLPAPDVVVQALTVSNPDTSVMVFSAPEQDMTVIWVFGLDAAAEQSLGVPEPARDRSPASLAAVHS